MWFIGVEVEQETSASPPKKNPGSAPALNTQNSSHQVIREFIGMSNCNTLTVS